MKFEVKKRLKAVVPLRLRQKFCSRFFLSQRKKKGNHCSGSTPVYLNVYDVTSMNGYSYWAGCGIYHSGVEVYGVEYAFGAHDYAASGVFEAEPRKCPGFKFRKTVFIGNTCLNPTEVEEFIDHYARNYNGDTYHLLAKNCNHFSNDMCYRLTGKHIPKWVNRLAKIGKIFNCVLSDAVHIPAVKHDPTDQVDDSEKKLLRTRFSSCLFSVSTKPQQPSASLLPMQSTLKGDASGGKPPRESNQTKVLPKKR